MDNEDVIEEIAMWLEDSIEIEEALKDGFYVEKYEHSAVIRWGSKKGDFPTLGSSLLLGETHIIVSGEKTGRIVISDMDAKTPIDVEQLAYKHFLETLMKDCDKGYEIETKPLNGEVFKIKVEKLDKNENINPTWLPGSD